MSAHASDDSLLMIRCPSCGQRFKVGENLLGRTVECGGCEHRFRIEDEVIVRGRKFYPGERKDPSLHRFQRVPLSLSPETGGQMGVRYNDPPDPSEFEPIAPQRVIAGLLGVAAMVLTGLFLIFGSSRGGALDGVSTTNRMVMAGFVGALGCGLLVFANQGSRFKGLVVGMLCTAGLMSLPLVFRGGSVPLRNEIEEVVIEAPAEEGKEEESIGKLRELIGTGPLEEEIEKHAGGTSGTHAVGLWVRNLRMKDLIPVRDFVFRATNAGLMSHPYPRGDRDYLFVLTEMTMTLEEVARVCRALGSVTKIYPELSVVEVRVDGDKFVSGSMEKLTDESDPAFYDLNKRELESIQVDRIKEAVRRLADAEPSVYRSDISNKMISLLGEDWVDFKGELCRALMVWAVEPGPAGDAALAEANELRRRQAEVPEDMVALIVKERNSGVLPLIGDLWEEDPAKWEGLYGDLGSLAEPALIEKFPETSGELRSSAVRLLGRVGGPASLPVLEGALEEADREQKVLIEQAENSIRNRM